MDGALSPELERRHANMRVALAEHEVDALVVAGNEYTGFEGAVTYMSGFQIVHRYAYVVLPADGDPSIVFPAEARYVGEHATSELEQVFHPVPGEAIAGRARDAGWRRIGVYGLSRASSSSRSTSSSTSRGPSSRRPRSSRSATRCGSTSAASRCSSRPTLRERARPR